MKNLEKLFLSCLILVTLAAYKKKDEGGSGGSTEGVVTAKIGGINWTSIKMSTSAQGSIILLLKE